MTTLIPATRLAVKNSRPYPNDSPEYRAARVALLAEEIELRRHIERVAEQRRALPMCTAFSARSTCRRASCRSGLQWP
jgi:predicted dithiol-disulfide oxidoreductase (DUF899 family)